VICVASGPSLSAEQGFRISSIGPEWKVIVINTTWQRVPMADLLYACDDHWWKHSHPAVASAFHGECWTASRWAAHRYGLNFVQAYDEPGLSRQPGIIHSGGNSGYQAVNLAYLFGARKIILVGYDMQRTYGMSHWHGDHPPFMGALPLPQMPYGLGTVSDPPTGMHDWVRRFFQLARDLHEEGVVVSNASIHTALPWFHTCTLEEALCR
jgi:hypothetical protein